MRILVHRGVVPDPEAITRPLTGVTAVRIGVDFPRAEILAEDGTVEDPVGCFGLV